MPSRDPLSKEQIKQALVDLPGWSHEEDMLHKSFEFDDFREAVAFIVRLAFEADEMDHHPEITNIYNEVKIALATHDAGDKVTGMDTELASRIDAAAR